MERVNDIIHFSTLVKEASSKRKPFFSNCYLLPGDITKYTQQNRIFWERTNSGLFFLCEEQDFNYLYFYLTDPQNKLTGLQLEKCSKPIVIDLVYLESNEPQSLSEIKEQWVNNGFCNHKIYRRMVLDIPFQDSLDAEKILIDHNKYEIGFAQPDYATDILKLWRNTLDIYSTALPYESELKNLLENKQILCVYDKNKKIVATTQQQSNGKVYVVKHIVVDENHRHHGLAKALLLTCFKNNKTINRYNLWVDEKNIPATTLYKQIGFNFDGKITSQLLLKN